jgi:hypothetical protein
MGGMVDGRSPQTKAGLQLRADLFPVEQGVVVSQRELSARIVAIEDEARGLAGLVCSLCLFVGDSDDPTPVTIMNGNLTCEPHNGYFQGDHHVQAIIAWKREHPAGLG